VCSEAQEILDDIAALRDNKPSKTGLDADINQTVRMLQAFMREL
jgi:hypothetical protein